MARGLFTNIYGKTEEGIFGSGLFSRHGSAPRYTSADIRLGNFSQAEDEEEEEESEEAFSPTPYKEPKQPLFAKQVAGFPLWLLGVVFLGFSWAVRKRRSKE